MDPAASPPTATLPRPLTSLVGRDAEINRLVGLVLDDATRLVTLVGVAGCGKTRLAVAVADRAPAASFVDFSALDAEADLATLAAGVLDVLGLTRRPDQETTQTVAEALSGTGRLLVLDNCEHVAAAAARLVEALLAAPGFSVLATSRQPLALPAERVWPVPPLTAQAALGLFQARMFERTGRPLPGGQADAAAEICAAVDQLPLAIELAAARAALLSVPEVLRLLGDRLRVLADAKSGGPEHHRTLRAALDWSYQLLTDDERSLLRRLAVFRGGWSNEAVAALPGHDLLAALAARSLVVLEVHNGQQRGRLLQTVAAYATSRLDEHPAEVTAARDAHAEFFVGLAERAEDGLRGPEQQQWLRTLTVEQENLRHAMAWLAARADNPADLRLAAALPFFHYLTGQYSQGRQWLVAAIARRPDAPAPLRVRACIGASMLAMLECDYSVSADLARRGLALAEAEGDHLACGRLLGQLGSVERERARYAESRRYLDRARSHYRQAGDPAGEARTTQQAAYTAWIGGAFDEASALLDAASEHPFDDEFRASTVAHLGAVACYRGDDEQARSQLTDALERFTALGFPEGIATVQELLARVDLRAAGLGSIRVSVPEDLLRASLAVQRRLGDRWRTASVLEALAEARRLAGQSAHAAALLGAADTIRDEIGAPTPACERASRDHTVTELAGPRFGPAYRFGRRTPLEELLTLSESLERTPS